MKILQIMRHAKSSHDNDEIDDFERPLNQRGIQDAPRIGQRLVDNDMVPNLVLSSKAVRARETARLVCEVANCLDQLKLRDSFYHGSPCDYLREVKLVPSSSTRLMLVGHNPGVEQLVERLTGSYERMPTGAIVFLQCEIQDWEEITSDCCRVCEVWRPREIFC